MADHKQSPEFLGGGPKFNTVGRDNRSAAGAEEPVVPVNQTGYWLRVAAIVAVLVVLAGLLVFLNLNHLGKTTGPSGKAITTDAHDAVPADPNMK